MAQERTYGVDWEPYREEILAFYVKQKKTAKETVQYLQERHGLQVTLRQFKFEFRGYKNLSAPDWTDTILPAIRKRSRNGQESDVYFRGEPLCPKRIRREHVRYLSFLPDDVSAASTPEEFGSSLEDRICIRTPPPSAALPSDSEEPVLAGSMVVDNVAEAAGMPHITRQTPNIEPTSPAPSPIFERGSSFQHLGMSGGFVVDLDEDLDIPLDSFAQLDGHDPDISSSMQPPPQPHLSPLVEPCNYGLSSQPESPFPPRLLSFDIARFHLLWNLPWFRLQDLVTATGFGFSSLNSTGPASSSAAANRSPSPDGCRPVDAMPLLRSFIGLSASSHADITSTVATRLRELIPARASPGHGSLAQIPLDEPQRPPIIQIFEIAAFMISNNKLSSLHLDTLVKWVIDHGQQGALMRFLDLDIAATKAMGPKLMEAGARLQQMRFVAKLSAVGVPFDDAAEELVRIGDVDYRTFVLSRIAPESLSGLLGRRLLLEVVVAEDISNAKLLLQAGVDLDAIEIEIRNRWSTPLVEAVRSGSLELVGLLVTNGADVNDWVYNAGPSGTNALIEAVTCGYTSIAKYLLDHGAAIDVLLRDENTVNHALRHEPEMLNLLKAAGSPIFKSVSDILSAASNRDVLSEFLSKRCVSPETAKKALKGALEKGMAKEAINLIQQGALHGCSQALRVVVGSGLDPTKMAMFVKLLVREGADPNIRGLLDPLLWKGDWQDGRSSIVVNLLIDAGFNLRQHGPAAVEKALYGGAEDAAWLLIERGAGLNSYGEHLTAFQAVAWRGSLRLLKSLADRGAEINQQHIHTGD